MDFDIGDIVRHTGGDMIGIVKLVDGVAVWVRWACGEINHVNCGHLMILDKAA